MAGPIRHKPNQVGMSAGKLRLGRKCVERVADRADHVDIAPLGARAEQIGLARLAHIRDALQRSGVVIDINPVADVLAPPIDRQLSALPGIQDGQGNELLGKLVRTEIIAAVRHDGRESVGAPPRSGEMVGRRLRGGVGRTRVVPGIGIKPPLARQRAVDFVGRNQDELELGALGLGEALPIDARDIEENRGPHHVCLHERPRSVDRTIDVGFRGKMENDLRGVRGEQFGHGMAVRDVGFLEPVIGRVLDRTAVCEEFAA